MKTRMSATRLVPAIACAACLLMSASAAHALSYSLSSQRFGGAGDDVGNSVAVDASGNVYVTGSFQGTVNFGGSDLVSAGLDDVFLAKYSAGGVHLWSLRSGGVDGDAGNSVAVDASGNVYVAGYFYVGGFVAKYDGAGVQQWIQNFGSAFGAVDPLCVAVGASGSAVVTGKFGGTVSFGGPSLVNAGLTDIFVVKYDAAGVHQWSQGFGDANPQDGRSVAVDASGNIIVTGFFRGTINVGGANLVDAAGGGDIWLARYNAAGVHQWSQRFGGGLSDIGHSVAVDASGNVFVTGEFQGAVNFGGATLSSLGGTDIFVAKYNGAGTHQWSQRFGGTGTDVGLAVAVDASGEALVTGDFQNTVNFGGGNLVSAGGYDFFVARYSAAGVHLSSLRAGSISDDIGYSDATDAAGNVVTTGSFYGTVDFGAGNLVGDPGGTDIFVAKYAVDAMEPSISSIVDVGNDQGRQVKIRIGRSGRDQAWALPHTVSYEAYRRDDPPPAASVVGTVPLSRRELLDLGWTFAGEVPAHGQLSYGLDAPTISDSTVALGAYNSTFFVRAATSDPLVYFDSPSASGYSLDNLAPPAPQNVAFAAGNLSWNESTAKDFDYFTVYGSNTNSFGAATLVDYSVAPAMNVVASPYVFYFITATDFAGNEGKPTKVNTLSGVGGTPTSYVLSVSNYPNPFNPRTTVGYTVPSHGAVTVAIYDLHGARVATLFEGERAAGAYSAEWDGRTDNAAVAASGVYFARIDHSSGTRSKKMVLLK